MKILFLSAEYPGVTENAYGTARRVCEIATMMAERGHEVQVLVASSRRRSWEHQGVICNEFAVGNRDSGQANPYDATARKVFANTDHYFSMLYQYWIECVDLFKRGFVPDIIESHEWYGIGYFYVQHRLLGYKDAVAPLVTTCAGPLFLLAEHDELQTHSKPVLWLMNKEKFQIAGSDGVVALSHFLSDSIYGRLHVERPQVHYPTSIHARPDSLLPACDNDELLLLGRMSPVKGLLPFLKVCTYLWDEGERFVVKLLGGTFHYPTKGIDMVDYIRQTYGEYVTKGYLKLLPYANDFNDIRNVMAQSRAVVHPSLFEALPTSCIQAMAHGRPVLASSTGGHAELVEHDRSGFVYHDPSELESYLKRVLRASRSELEDWGFNANLRVCELCDPARGLSLKEQYYRQIIERGTSSNGRVFPCPGFLEKERFPVFPLPDFKSVEEQEAEKDLLSVVIPCFNLGPYVREAVESAYVSDYRPIEVIVIDDASTDNATKEALKGLSLQFPEEEAFSLRILFEQRNKGVAQVRNLGAAVSKGEYLCFLDADDRVESSYFSKGMAVFKKYPNVGLVTCWVEAFGELSGNWLPLNIEFPEVFFENCFHAATLMRTEAYQPQWSTLLGEDYEGWLSVTRKGWSGLAIPEVLFFYQVRSDSKFHSACQEELKVGRAVIAKRHRDLYRLFGDDIFLVYYQNFHFEVKSWEQNVASVKAQYQEAMERLGRAELQLKAFDLSRSVRLGRLFRFYQEHPAQIWKLPYGVCKILFPLNVRGEIHRVLGVPAGKNLSGHVRQTALRGLKRLFGMSDRSNNC